MLQLFSFRVAEWPPVWERAILLVYYACLSRMFINMCVFFSFKFWGWDVEFLINAFLFTLICFVCRLPLATWPAWHYVTAHVPLARAVAEIRSSPVTSTANQSEHSDPTATPKNRTRRPAVGVCRVLCVDLMWLLLPTYLNMERVRMLNHNLWIMCRTEDFICKIKVAYYCSTFTRNDL